MGRKRLGWVLSAALAWVGCEGGGLLIIEVRATGTADFDAVRLEVTTDTGEPVEEFQHTVTPDDNFAESFRLRELELEADTYLVTVSLTEENDVVESARSQIAVIAAHSLFFSFDAEPCQPTEETCSGRDDDCDGVVDEDPETLLCSGENVESARCSEAVCVIEMCSDSTGDCDGDAATGCETDLMVSADHCGSCDRACEDANSCDRAQCRAFGQYDVDRPDELFRLEVMRDRRFASLSDTGEMTTIEQVNFGEYRISHVGSDLELDWTRLLRADSECDAHSLTSSGVNTGAGSIRIEVSVRAGAGCNAELLDGDDLVVAVASGEERNLLLTYQPTGTLEHATELPTEMRVFGVAGNEIVVGGEADAGTDLGEGPLSEESEFVARYALSDEGALGELRWLVQPRNLVDLVEDGPNAFQTNASGDLLLSTRALTGPFVDPGTGEEIPLASQMTVLVEYSAAGELLFLKRFDGAVRAVAIGPEGDAAALVEPDAATPTLVIYYRAADGRELTFAIPYFSEWRLPYPTTRLLLTENHDIYLASELELAVDFGGGLRQPLLNTIFVSSWNAEGDYRWDWVSDREANSRVYSVGWQDDDGLVITGSFVGDIDFGGGLRSATEETSFILRLLD